MENAFLALQVVGLAVGPITIASSFMQNQPRLATCAYSLDPGQSSYGTHYPRYLYPSQAQQRCCYFAIPENE